MIRIARKGMWVILDGCQIGLIVDPLTFPDEAERTANRNRRQGGVYTFTVRPRLTPDEKWKLSRQPRAKVDLVNPIGETFATIYDVKYSRLRQAKWDEIPDSRKPKRTERIIGMGYLKPDAALEE